MTTDVVLTVDAELFVHTPAYRRAEGTVADETVGLEGIEYLLDLFERHEVTSTFFVVSGIAESHPNLVERIADAGHEVASHTRTHRLLPQLDATDREDELVRSKETLEDVTGRTVTGFRAPAFDRPDGLFEALSEAGYRYDSSVAPARAVPGWYGGEYGADRPVRASTLEGGFPTDLTELPISVSPWLRLPISAAWIRLLGRRYLRWSVDSLHGRGIVPVVYVHPWEFVDLPRVEGVPKRVYWHTGAWFRRTIESLVAGEYEFRTAVALADTVEGS